MGTVAPDSETLLVEHNEGATGTESIWDLSDPAMPVERARLTADDGLGSRPLTNEIDADSQTGYVFTPGSNDVTVIDLDEATVRTRIDLGGSAFVGTWDPSHSKLYVPDERRSGSDRPRNGRYRRPTLGRRESIWCDIGMGPPSGGFHTVYAGRYRTIGSQSRTSTDHVLSRKLCLRSPALAIASQVVADVVGYRDETQYSKGYSHFITYYWLSGY